MMFLGVFCCYCFGGRGVEGEGGLEEGVPKEGWGLSGEKYDAVITPKILRKRIRIPIQLEQEKKSLDKRIYALSSLQS